MSPSSISNETIIKKYACQDVIQKGLNKDYHIFFIFIIMLIRAWSNSKKNKFSLYIKI